MKIIGFFNNTGGVGKTSLVYHVAWMMSELGLRVVAADLDPQANLSSAFLDEDRLEELWTPSPRLTIHGAVSPQFRGRGDVQSPHVEEITDSTIGLLAGDLELSRFEDDLSACWPKCGDRDERSFLVVSAFARVISMAGRAFAADIALVDVGPNLGALNRAALLACDHLVVPLGADLFSLQGLRNMGPALRSWREEWADRRERCPDKTLELPRGTLTPAGYVVVRHSERQNRPVRAFGKWIARIPAQYRESVLNEPPGIPTVVENDPFCLANIRDYRSLMPMAQEHRRPMFRLLPAHGAIGSHQNTVRDCWKDFDRLTRRILDRCGVPLPGRGDSSSRCGPA